MFMKNKTVLLVYLMCITAPVQSAHKGSSELGRGVRESSDAKTQGSADIGLQDVVALWHLVYGEGPKMSQPLGSSAATFELLNVVRQKEERRQQKKLLAAKLLAYMESNSNENRGCFQQKIIQCDEATTGIPRIYKIIIADDYCKTHDILQPIVVYLQDPERAGGKDTRIDIGIDCHGKIKKPEDRSHWLS